MTRRESVITLKQPVRPSQAGMDSKSDKNTSRGETENLFNHGSTVSVLDAKNSHSLSLKSFMMEGSLSGCILPALMGMQ